MNDLSSQSVSNSLTSKKPRVAVLIDGENISHAMAGQIIMKSCVYGELVIRRVYGNAARLTGWDTAPGFRLVHSGSGKNATDILLSVEATALMLTNKADVLVIAASDRDYTHVAAHLREVGYKVVGLGEEKAPEAFRKSCSKFVTMASVLTPLEFGSNVIAPPKKKPASLQEKVAALIASSGATAMVITTLNIEMHKLHGIRISLEPEKTWRRYLEARPDEFVCDPKGSGARVRLCKVFTSSDQSTLLPPPLIPLH